jgi:hypothetical protein
MAFSLIAVNAQTQLDPGNKKSTVIWKTVNGVLIPVPPEVHPRLFINPEEAALMGDRLANTVIAPLKAALDQRASAVPDAKVEWDAVKYLVHKNEITGRQIITSTLAIVKSTNGSARVNGRMMVTGAVVYDWLYPLLTETEKLEFKTEFIRLAKSLESGYPPNSQGNVTGHSSETFIMRDMLAAGIAMYDEFPEMYELAAARFFGKLVPVRNWLYKGHAYHQGDSYGPSRFNHEIVPNFIFKTMGVENIYDENQKYVPYYFLYSTRPDGSRLRSGDTFLHNSYSHGEIWDTYSVNVLMASYYNDGILMDYFLKQGATSVKNNEYLFAFLWWDPTVQPIPANTLPLSRYFGDPFGWMIARTGWHDKAALAEMKVNVYNFVNHQHLDAGSFQIYYRGPLAAESGLYTGTSGDYGSPHNKNYYKRTIAHNSLLIYNPSETFKADHTNDGGQRLPNGRAEANDLDALINPNNGYKTGSVDARGFGPDNLIPEYTYLKGDITEAYSSKVSKVKRSFVFLNLLNEDIPAAMIVFDKIISSSANYKKFWLLHSISEPAISGNEVTILRVNARDNGKLINTTLLPEADNMEITSIGGPGKEFWVFGTNYPNESNARSYEKASWRIELSPKVASQEDYFLNTMQVMESNVDKFNVKKLDGDLVVGSSIADRIVFFSKNSEALSNEFSFSFQDEGNFKILITDLQAGNWKISKNGDVLYPSRIVKPEDGIIYFEGTAGNYLISQNPNSVTETKTSSHKAVVYPNPFTDNFDVAFDFEVNEIRISDLGAKTLLSYNVNLSPGIARTISPDNLLPGVYIVSGHNKVMMQSSILIRK